MANEITEIDQFATYGGQTLTLAGSDLASKLSSLLTREGSGSARGWKLFDPTKADYLNTKKVLNPGDIVLVNPKVVPMDFPIQTSGTSSGNKTLPAFVGPAGETLTEFEETYFFDQNATPSVTFSQGAGTVELSYDEGASWATLGPLIAANNGFKVRVQHPNNNAFSATISLAY